MVQRIVPPPLRVETFDGSAWVAVAPFIIRDLRPPWLPPLPWVSAFPETNCRTYVTAPDGAPGVWFFSLDAARATAVAAARLAYGLPYAWSRMRVSPTERRVCYRSSRRWPDTTSTTSIEIEKGEPLHQGELEIFLTARFRLYSFVMGRLTYTAIDHAPWPLRSANVISLQQNLTAAAGLAQPSGPPLAHYSPSVYVRIARPKAVRRV
jgi:uncharacterized protein YqjF (DUF2071 family)